MKSDLDEVAYMGFCLILILFIFFLNGCSTLSTISGPSTGAIYKNDILGTINGVAFNGVGVIPASPQYDMKITSRVDVDLLTIKSCHRDFSVESAIKLGWFESKRSYEYIYNPMPNIEDLGSCLVHIGSYSQASGQNAWGVVDFETPDADLPAENICDGADKMTNGVSICQAQAGLIQEIVFKTPVKQSGKLDPKCQMTSGDGLRWQYHMPLGECVIAFGEINEPYRIHRHDTIGFTDILIRGGP